MMLAEDGKLHSQLEWPKQSFLIKCVNDLAFYNYSSVL